MGAVVRKLAYFPPTPPTYQWAEGQAGARIAWHLDEGLPPELEETFAMLPVEEEERFLSSLRARTPREVATLRLRHRHKAAAVTVLYSHGNAEDLGIVRVNLVHLCRSLGVDAIALDYAGYGLSRGEPSEEATYADIETVLQHLLKNEGLAPSSIVVFGRSLGSGPATELAMRHPDLRGLVLQSPIASAVRVVMDAGFTLPFDMYANTDKIKRIQMPVFIMHGTRDDVVPVEHGQLLAKKTPRLWKLWLIEGAGHNDVEVRWTTAYLDHLDAFFRHLLE